MKCIVVFCHSTIEDDVRQVLEEVGCQHYVGVDRAFARDGDERRLNSRYHPGADVAVMAFVDALRVDDVIAAISRMSAREHSAHTRLAVVPVERFV